MAHLKGLEANGTTRQHASDSPDPRLDQALREATAALLERQAQDGSFCWPLEADCTIPAEYVLLMHFLDEVEEGLERKLGRFLRRHQAEHGGWPLYDGGELNISCTVKAYWALKLVGDDVDAPHMRRARAAILAGGGAARSNVFTRIALALFGQVPWKAVPWLPVEIVLLPRWFPFHISKVSYWSRTVMVPLAILCSLKAKAKNPRRIDVRELFTVPPEEERHWFPIRSPLNRLFFLIERTARLFEPLIPRSLRSKAFAEAERWTRERLNGVDGLGAIFPAMVNAYEALLELGADPAEPAVVQAREALSRLLVIEEDEAWCQPCASPVWDTALATLALEEVSESSVEPNEPGDVGGTRVAIRRSLDWLVTKQVLDGPADWRTDRPHLAPGGWPFQYANAHYPDLDDTAACVWALQRFDPERYAEPVRRALDWLRGMESKKGGFAAFDADNDLSYLNEIPFADHGALLDPPTADVSARCALAFGFVGRTADREAMARTVSYLEREQEAWGSWFGRWGTNHVYGTWSVLSAFEHVSDSRKGPLVRRAVAWLESVQGDAGGWGETNDSYLDSALAGRGDDSNAFQTAWACLALLSAGEGDSEAVRRGIMWLLEHRAPDGLWESERFTAPGFPRVFYLRYQGYVKYFPLWALARYRAHLAAREKREVAE